jgi:glycosyltransferase involved in cell wall biosynthesis
MALPVLSAVTERLPISVVVPTLNEGLRLEAALATVRWADEIIVVDAGSTDDTTTVARRCGARVMSLSGTTIAAQRNAGIAAARNQWIFALDADEQVTPELRESLSALCDGRNTPHRAFRVRSRNWHLGRELRHGPWGRDWKVRVFSREERFNDRRVHENLETLDDVGALDGALLHHPYRDLSHQVVKIAQYAKWGAQDLRAGGKQPSVAAMIFRPVWRFFRDYVLLGGWRDGAAGFVVATVSAFAVFLKYAALLLSE